MTKPEGLILYYFFHNAKRCLYPNLIVPENISARILEGGRQRRAYSRYKNEV
jgi:hypothetical protein